ncbi:hypothetical protein ACTFIW_003851 [Dictyostelium discoideum]
MATFLDSFNNLKEKEDDNNDLILSINRQICLLILNIVHILCTIIQLDYFLNGLVLKDIITEKYINDIQFYNKEVTGSLSKKAKVSCTAKRADEETSASYEAIAVQAKPKKSPVPWRR